MSAFTIQELQSKKDIRFAFPVMKQLRSHLDEQSFLELVIEAQEKEQYKLFALTEKGVIAAVVGFQPMLTLYYGRFIWNCDLVTDEEKRSKGYGKKLLAFVHDWARKNNYERVALSSGVQRIEAHRFYEEKMNDHKASFVFTRRLF